MNLTKRAYTTPKAAKIIAAALMALSLATPAAAQERNGIAFVQAPEQSSGACVAPTATEGFACAVKQCVEGGALAEDCIQTNWCQPAGWSVDVFLQHNEGVHWHEISCGWTSRAAAMAAAKILCDPTERQYVVDCIVTAVFDPQGKRIAVE